jgi:drug/metabolite transporter (DMT)-like permease
VAEASLQTSAFARRAILFMALGVFSFTALDALAKGLVATYPTIEVIWARFIGQLVFVMLFLGRRIGPALVTRFPAWHVARAVTQLVATGFFFASLNFMGLAEATALAAIGPVLITLGAGLFLGERLGLPRIVSVFVALAGALIIIRPGLGVFDAAALLPIVCAVGYAANMLLTRHIGSRESPWTAMLYSAVFGTILCSLVLPFSWHPIAPADLPAFVLLAATGALAQLFIIKAYSLAEASVIAPFGYLDIVFASFWGILVFAEYPDGYTILGALVIAAAGLYVWRQEMTAPKQSPKPNRLGT